jgi:hypothetical protein
MVILALQNAFIGNIKMAVAANVYCGNGKPVIFGKRCDQLLTII